MKRQLLAIFSLFVCITVQGQSIPDPLPSPIQTGAYLPGLISPRDFANPGTSGLVALDYNIFFNTNEYFDKQGNSVNSIEIFPEPMTVKVPIETDIGGYINALAIAYISPEIKALGNARYIGCISPYFSTANFKATLNTSIDSTYTISGSTGGIGDIMVAPGYLSWSDANSKFDITAGYLFSAPTGRYETGADDNIGLGYWNHVFQVFNYFYLMPKKASALFIGNTFETHSKIKDVDVKPGNRYTLEYGLSQYLSERLEITAQGGHTWQIGEDSGDDVYWDATYKDKYSIIGLGLGYWPIKQTLYLNAKWMTNYAIRQHFKYNSFQLQIIFIPNILKAIADK